MRRILLAAVVVMAFGSLLPAGDAQAAPTTCTLAPVDGTAVAIMGEPSEFRAMWMAMTTDCTDPDLNGQEVELHQAARVQPQGGRMVGGPTRIMLECTCLLPDLPLTLSGQVRGMATMNPDGSVTLDLEIRASGDGARLHGFEMLTIDRSTGEVLQFKPGLYDAIVIGSGFGGA